MRGRRSRKAFHPPPPPPPLIESFSNLAGHPLVRLFDGEAWARAAHATVLKPALTLSRREK